MKKLSILLLLAVSIGLSSCFGILTSVVEKPFEFNPEILNQLKNEKVVIATLEYPKKANAQDKEQTDMINEYLVAMLQTHWNYCEIHDRTMPYDEAVKFIKKNDGYHLLHFGITEYAVSCSTGGKSEYSSIGLKLNYCTNLHTFKMAAYETPFSYNESFLNEVSAYATIKGLDDMLKQIETKKIKSQYTFPVNKSRNTQELKNKTLLIPEYMINEELGEEGIKEYYKYDFEICSKEKFENALLYGMDGYMIPLYTTVPSGQNVFDQFMIYDSMTWECYMALRWGQHSVTNFKIFNAEEYDEFLKMNKKSWKLIAKGMKSI